MARKRSFIRTVILLMTVQLALLTLLLFFLVWTAMRSARTEMVTVSDNLLEVSVTNLQNRLERADSTLKNIVLDQETNLSQLQSADEAARSYARQQLSNTMHSVLNSDSAVDMLVVAENRYDTCLDAEVRTIGGAQKGGTSALAGTFSQLGLSLGDELMPATADANPKGYFEHVRVVQAHDRLLAAFGMDWADPRPLPESWMRHPVTLQVRAELEQVMSQLLESAMACPNTVRACCRWPTSWRPNRPRAAPAGCS